MSDVTSFVSVKLTASLVRHARETAMTMRRSVASQIEYWATLGRALEQAGLTATDSHALILRQERPVYHAMPSPLDVSPDGGLDELHAHVIELAKSGALHARVDEAVKARRRKSDPSSTPKQV